MTTRRRKQRDRLFWRGDPPRAQADLRDYADVGGGRVALKAPGEHWATTDPDVARALLTARLKELDAKRRGRALHGDQKAGTLAEVARLDLIVKRDSDKFTESHLAAVEARLRVVLAFLGGPEDPEARRLDPNTLDVTRVRELVAYLQRLPNRRGGTMSGGNVRHYLNALSGVYKRAGSEKYVPPGFNPVSALLEKPTSAPPDARWLQSHEAALLLETARRYVAPKDGTPFAQALVGFFLLTGCRETEGYGVELDDVSFERETITFRPNRWRRLKTKGSARVVPLWPQLSKILKDYLKGPHRPTGDLLFPSYAGGREAMLTDCRKLLDHLAVRSGLARPLTDEAGKPLAKAGRPVLDFPLRTKMFRHTYCSARLQTLDGDAPVAPFTVSRELGHGSLAMVTRVYSHLGTVRHRAKVVEYRVEQHRAAVLRDGTTVAARVAALSESV
jgi:integrase